MTDILIQLRSAPIRLTNLGENAERLILEAADEIERWRSASEFQEAGQLHVRATDSYPEVDVEVTNGERLQPSMSPVTFYVRK